MTQNMREVFGKYLPPEQETMDSIWALIKNNHRLVAKRAKISG